jgi:hypothetical protein
MSMPPMMRHIRYAEQWLRWARADYRRGEVRGAILRLMVAEAEIRHARAAGMSTTPEPPRVVSRSGRLAAVAMGSAAVLLLGLGYPLFRGGESGRQPAAVTQTTSAPFGPVQLQSGSLLVLVPPGDVGRVRTERKQGSSTNDAVLFSDPSAPWNGGGQGRVVTVGAPAW